MFCWERICKHVWYVGTCPLLFHPVVLLKVPMLVRGQPIHASTLVKQHLPLTISRWTVLLYSPSVTPRVTQVTVLHDRGGSRAYLNNGDFRARIKPSPKSRLELCTRVDRVIHWVMGKVAWTSCTTVDVGKQNLRLNIHFGIGRTLRRWSAPIGHYWRSWWVWSKSSPSVRNTGFKPPCYRLGYQQHCDAMLACHTWVTK